MWGVAGSGRTAGARLFFSLLASIALAIVPVLSAEPPSTPLHPFGRGFLLFPRVFHSDQALCGGVPWSECLRILLGVVLAKTLQLMREMETARDIGRICWFLQPLPALR